MFDASPAIPKLFGVAGLFFASSHLPCTIRQAQRSACVPNWIRGPRLLASAGSRILKIQKNVVA
jgi:hypothetical protein